MRIDGEDDKDLETGDLNVAEALDEISENLFGQGDDGTEVKGGDGEEVGEQGETPEPLTSVETPPAQTGQEDEKPAEGENSPEVQALGAPSTWTKEAIAKWATIDPEVQAQILKREEDMFEGIKQYKERAELGSRYDKVVEPYRPILTAQNVDPVELFHNFAGNHYILMQGTEAQKTQLAANLLSAYGINVEAVKGLLGEQPQIDPAVKALQDELRELKSGQSQREAQEREERLRTYQAEVAEFRKDKPYFDELASDIALFVRNGASLQDAYDKAIYSNPQTRQKELDRLTAERASQAAEAAKTEAEKIAKAKAANVKTSQKTVGATSPVGSLDDTLNETMQKIASRG